MPQVTNISVIVAEPFPTNSKTKKCFKLYILVCRKVWLIYNVLSLQFLSEIQRVNFNVSTTHVSFNSDGDPRMGYDIVYWNMSEFKQGAKIETIGKYSPDGKIKIPLYLFKDLINDTVRGQLT